MIGREDEAVLRPAVEAARARGVDVTGPWPGDTVFGRAARGEFDAVIACYHDQGLIPVKLLAFGRAVNVTLGLPIVRTSVDHGTAFDIAGRGVADPSSLIEAVRLAAQLAGKPVAGKREARSAKPEAGSWKLEAGNYAWCPHDPQPPSVPQLPQPVGFEQPP